jgi:hypothetical protein
MKQFIGYVASVRDVRSAFNMAYRLLGQINTQPGVCFGRVPPTPLTKAAIQAEYRVSVSNPDNTSRSAVPMTLAGLAEVRPDSLKSYSAA